jgi:hypothetical protein
LVAEVEGFALVFGLEFGRFLVYVHATNWILRHVPFSPPMLLIVFACREAELCCSGAS